MKKEFCDFCGNKSHLDKNNLCDACSDLLNNWVDVHSFNNGLFDKYITKNNNGSKKRKFDINNVRLF